MEQDTLERPAVADQPETAMTTLPPETRAVLALNSSKTELDLRALATKHVTIVEIKDRAGREQAHGAAMELMRARTAIEKVSKDARDDATRFSKAVIAEEKRLVGIVEAEEKRLKGLRDDWDEAEQKRREAAAAAERARVLAITTRIAEINAKSVLAAQCRTAAAVQRLIDALEAVDMTGFEEFEAEAVAAKSAAIASMAALRDAKRAEEDERARIKAEQEAEAARLAEERAEIARQRAELDAAKAAQAAQAKTTEPEPVKVFAEPAGPLEPIDPVVGSAEFITDLDIAGITDGDVAYLPVTMIDPAPPVDPADADVMWIAASAVADAYGWTTADAIARLAAIDWQI